MENEKIKCILISVDCVDNDPVDIRSGGPKYLGFDFYVSKEKQKEMLKFIVDKLKELTIPFININIDHELDLIKKHIWDEEKIYECLKANAEDLIQEYNKSHNKASKRR